MSGSILNDTKKILGLDEDYDVFDTDVTIHINSAFSTLNQLGLGPVDGFEIADDSAVWTDFIGDDPRLNSVKTYIWLKVRLWFDPPSTSYLVEALKQQSQELEWRLNVVREGDEWTAPSPM